MFGTWIVSPDSFDLADSGKYLKSVIDFGPGKSRYNKSKNDKKEAKNRVNLFIHLLEQSGPT